MTLKRRVDRLTAAKGRCDDGPSVIFLCAGDTGEAWAAMLKGRGTLLRDPDETEADFVERASAGEGDSVTLPLDAREALAAESAPNWAKGALVLRALREKHARKP